MRDLHRFDPYLQFASPDEEAQYRRRQTERTAYIEQQHAKGTPQGDLNANAAALGQLVDAEAHGAAVAPGFAPRVDAIAASYRRLHGEIGRNGGSTREADERLARDVRQSLLDRGKTDREIDALFAAQGGDPLAVIEASRTATPADTAAAKAGDAGPTPPPSPELADAMAALRAAGVTSSPAEIAAAAPTPQLPPRAQPLGRG